MRRLERNIDMTPSICDDCSIRIELRNLDGVRRAQLIANRHVLEGARICGRMRQRACEGLAAVYECLAPDILLHSLRAWHPRTARFAPAGRPGDGLLHSELVRESCCVLQGILPLGSHVDQAPVDNLRRLQGCIEMLK